MATHQDLPPEEPVYSDKPTPGGGITGSIGSPSNQNLIAAVAYLGWAVTGVAILILEKDNSYIRFHAMQSTLLSAVVLFLNIALEFIPLGGLGFLAGQFITMVAFIVWIVLLYKAFSGEEYELPYLGPFSRQQLSRM